MAAKGRAKNKSITEAPPKMIRILKGFVDVGIGKRKWIMGGEEELEVPGTVPQDKADGWVKAGLAEWIVP